MTPQEIIDHVAHVLLRGLTAAQAEAIGRALGPELPERVERMSGSDLDRLLADLGLGRTRWPPEGWQDFAAHRVDPRDYLAPANPWDSPDPDEPPF